MSFNDHNMFWDHYVKDTTHSGNISYWNGNTSKRKTHVLIREWTKTMNTGCARNLNIPTTRLRHKRGWMLVTKMITHFYLLPRKTVGRKDRKVGKSKELEKARKDPTDPHHTRSSPAHCIDGAGLCRLAPSAAQAWEAAICSFCFPSVTVRSNRPKQWWNGLFCSSSTIKDQINMWLNMWNCFT